MANADTPPDAEQALKQWLRTRDKTRRYLFYGRSDKPLTYASAWNAMRKTLERADLLDKGDSPHSLRHTFATEMINAGISGHKVPDLQGRLDRDVLSKEPTVVFIYIGINDVWHSLLLKLQGRWHCPRIRCWSSSWSTTRRCRTASCTPRIKPF